jgi:hypothetical protein
MNKQSKKICDKVTVSENTSKIPEYLVPHILRMTDQQCCSYIDPPGCYSDSLETPYPSPIYSDGRKGCIEVGVFYEHRFAFYYWMKWRKEKSLGQRVRNFADFVAPNLVTMDWHNDFGNFHDFNKNTIQSLNQTKNLGEVALFTWLGLRSLNDGHILPALWLNAIGDVYLITKQVGQRKKIETIKDCFGNAHKVHYVKGLSSFAKRWKQHYCESRSQEIYWDIDLDYFTKEGKRLNGSIMSETAIRKVLSMGDEGIQIILDTISGLTFALEPYYSRGIFSALKLYSIWENIFLKGNIKPLPLKDCHWRKKYSQ